MWSGPVGRMPERRRFFFIRPSLYPTRSPAEEGEGVASPRDSHRPREGQTDEINDGNDDSGGAEVDEDHRDEDGVGLEGVEHRAKAGREEVAENSRPVEAGQGEDVERAQDDVGEDEGDEEEAFPRDFAVDHDDRRNRVEEPDEGAEPQGGEEEIGKR